MSRQATLLVFLAAALLLVTGVILFRLVPLKRELPVEEPAQVGRESRSTRVESTPSDARSAPLAEAPAPLPSAQPPEDLRAEGARRGWQLPFGKGWWTDELVNPGGVDPDAATTARLQERVVALSDQLNALRQRRKQRLDAYCQERVAAGVAVEDDSHAFPADGKEHHWITVSTPSAPNRTFRVDVAVGDDAELDQLDKRLASAWCEAVLELRRLFAK